MRLYDDDDFGYFQGVEDVTIEQLIAELGVEALAIAAYGCGLFLGILQPSIAQSRTSRRTAFQEADQLIFLSNLTNDA
jgi:hypothetical protein